MRGDVNERNLTLLKLVKFKCKQYGVCEFCPLWSTNHVYCHARVFFEGEMPERVSDGHLFYLSRNGALPEDLWDELDERLKEGET